MSFEKIFGDAYSNAYNRYFSHILHENRLGRDRLALLAQVTSLLLIAYASALMPLALHYSEMRPTNSALAHATHGFQILLVLVGLFFALSARIAIEAAYRAMNKYADKLAELGLEHPEIEKWPPILGAGNQKDISGGWALLRAAPTYVILLWSLIGTVSVGLWVYLALD